jgi:hypothetical protein
VAGSSAASTCTGSKAGSASSSCNASTADRDYDAKAVEGVQARGDRCARLRRRCGGRHRQRWMCSSRGGDAQSKVTWRLALLARLSNPTAAGPSVNAGDGADTANGGSQPQLVAVPTAETTVAMCAVRQAVRYWRASSSRRSSHNGSYPTPLRRKHVAAPPAGALP